MEGWGCLKSQSAAEFRGSVGGGMRYYTHPFFLFIRKVGVCGDLGSPVRSLAATQEHREGALSSEALP